jgi:hypothetical protein
LELGHHKVIHPSVHYVGQFPTVTRRIDNYFHPNSFQNGKWFLNVDLQGYELNAIKGMGDMLRRFDWVYAEVNKKETYVGCALVGDLDEYLEKFGFERVETGVWVGDTWTDALYCKKK